MSDERFFRLRLVEALLFAASGPLSEKDLAVYLPAEEDIPALLEELRAFYANRGVHLTKIGEGWALRTAPDLAEHLRITRQITRKLSRAAVETLAIIAYHQPVTRAEIEEIRGVVISKGTLDTLLEAGWIAPKGRRQTPGRPVTWVTSPAFLDHFGLESLEALPGIEELRAAGLLDARAGVATLGTQAFTEQGALSLEERAEAEEGDEGPQIGEEDEKAWADMADMAEREEEREPIEDA
ncbi:MAG TPA: SMC-Scp complex subunit ScpB [Dongiaceae bacterium]|jgi:segregation and condensation protein B|nr:SMC-Scp complex subunit ScpB [Dongiaceae bacterium]